MQEFLIFNGCIKLYMSVGYHMISQNMLILCNVQIRKRLSVFSNMPSFCGENVFQKSSLWVVYITAIHSYPHRLEYQDFFFWCNCNIVPIDLFPDCSPSLPRFRQPSLYSQFLWDEHFKISPVNEILWCWFFSPCVWLILNNVMISSSIYVVINSRASPFLFVT